MTDTVATPFPLRPTGVRLPVPVAATQGTLALAILPRHEPPPPAGDAGAGSVVVPIDQRQRRAVEEWARRYVQAAVEIVGGDRPASQLLRWTTPEVYADLRRRALLVARAGGHQPGLARVQPVRPRVLSVHACFLSTDVVEAAVHVRYGERSRALATRFERVRQRWLCSALDYS
ncbi:Rv3235 family protein [Nocardioides sp. TF02-7]|uniref:Rv3235 family protein n=1 Tax=Nocardioides sp. TF02-7 TaxID=2917724 RepID=UPI001F0667B9|nr:Rv3235 family protein [Nocardioides sp. TF02-7]UMG91712.1 Rv3235 family protein [Nocardioides sp. TF02-7]